MTATIHTPRPRRGRKRASAIMMDAIMQMDAMAERGAAPDEIADIAHVACKQMQALGHPPPPLLWIACGGAMREVQLRGAERIDCACGRQA